MGLFWQFYGTCSICLLSLIMGLMFAWPSSTIQIFKSPQNTNLVRSMTPTEISLFSSLSSVGALIGTPLFGFALDKIGRKYSAIFAGLSYVLAWTMIATSQKVEIVLTAVFISGLGGAVVLTGPLYVAEICQRSIRGALTSGSVIFYGLGVLLAYVLGGYMPYYGSVCTQLILSIIYVLLVSVLKESPLYLMKEGKDEKYFKGPQGALTSGSVIFYGLGVLLAYVLGGYMPYYGSVCTQLILSIIYVLLVSVLKESPLYLMKEGKEEEAAQSIAFYRSVDTNSKEVLEEMENLRRALNPIDAISSPEEESILNKIKLQSKKKQEKLSTLKFIAQSPSTKTALFLTGSLMTGCIFMGLSVIQVYAEPLFQRLVPDWSANFCSIMLAVVAILANLIAAYCADKLGRKALMTYSAMASGFSLFALATQIQYEWGPHWLTAVLVYAFCVAFSLGSGTIPYVLVAEVFLPEVKSFCSMLIIEWGWLINFLLLFAFNPLEESVGLAVVFYFFSIVCFGAMLFSMVYQRETKGLPVDVIQKLFLKRETGNDKNRVV